MPPVKVYKVELVGSAKPKFLRAYGFKPITSTPDDVVCFYTNGTASSGSGYFMDRSLIANKPSTTVPDITPLLQADMVKVTIEVTPQNSGKTRPTPAVHYYEEGRRLRVVADPDAAFEFDMWELKLGGHTQNIGRKRKRRTWFQLKKNEMKKGVTVKLIAHFSK